MRKQIFIQKKKQVRRSKLNLNRFFFLIYFFFTIREKEKKPKQKENQKDKGVSFLNGLQPRGGHSSRKM